MHFPKSAHPIHRYPTPAHDCLAFPLELDPAGSWLNSESAAASSVAVLLALQLGQPGENTSEWISIKIAIEHTKKVTRANLPVPGRAAEDLDCAGGGRRRMLDLSNALKGRQVQVHLLHTVGCLVGGGGVGGCVGGCVGFF